MKRPQQGFAVLETVLILVVVGIIGFTGWYVWHSKQAAEKAQSDSLAVVNDSNQQVNGQQSSIAFKDTEPGLQAAIFSAAKEAYPECYKGENLAGYAAGWFAQNDPVHYDKTGFAITGISNCDNAAGFLFVKTEAGWKSVDHTMDLFLCDPIEKYEVPASLLEYVEAKNTDSQITDKAQCRIDNNGNVKTLDS